MTGYSEAKLAAIAKVSLNCQKYKRTQRKHGLFPDNSDIFLTLIRDIAQAPSPKSKDLPIGHYYQEQVENLKKEYGVKIL